jgi:hypothetical protein
MLLKSVSLLYGEIVAVPPLRECSDEDHVSSGGERGGYGNIAVSCAMRLDLRRSKRSIPAEL